MLIGHFPPCSKAHHRKAVPQIEAPWYYSNAAATRCLLKLYVAGLKPEVLGGLPWPWERRVEALGSWTAGRPPVAGLPKKGGTHHINITRLTLGVSIIRTRGERAWWGLEHDCLMGLHSARPSASVQSLLLDSSNPLFTLGFRV